MSGFTKKGKFYYIPKLKDNNELSKVAIIHHSSCIGHKIRGHVESPARVETILEYFKKSFGKKLSYRIAEPVTDEQILLFHTKPLLERFKYLAKKAEDEKTIIPIDGDTQVMNRTREAVYHAAGAVITAVDLVYLPDEDPFKVDSAFCCVRPPGHHAERAKSCGFCFFNNVGIGARYAQEKYGVKKVAVLDPDVHHGNGTEDGFAPDPFLFYASTHERDNFPGTGLDPSPNTGEKAKNEIDRRIVNRILDRGPSSKTQFREKWVDILKEMERFQPELVFISAGFDAHDDDPLSWCELEEEDYRWFTEQVLLTNTRISKKINKTVPTISVLEGGYNLIAIGNSSVAHVEALLNGVEEKGNTIISGINEIVDYVGEKVNEVFKTIDEITSDFGNITLEKTDNNHDNDVKDEKNGNTSVEKTEDEQVIIVKSEENHGKNVDLSDEETKKLMELTVNEIEKDDKIGKFGGDEVAALKDHMKNIGIE